MNLCRTWLRTAATGSRRIWPSFPQLPDRSEWLLASAAAAAAATATFHSTPANLAKGVSRKQRRAQIRKLRVAKQEAIIRARENDRPDPLLGVSTDFTRSLLRPDRLASARTGANLLGGRGSGGGGAAAAAATAAAEANVDETQDLQRHFFLAAGEADRLVARLREDEVRKVGATDEQIARAEQIVAESSRREDGGEAGQTQIRKKTVDGEKIDPISRKVVRVLKSENLKSAAFKRLVNLQTANSKGVMHTNIQNAVAHFGETPRDTGSAQVQAGCFTVRIHTLVEHLRKNRHDHATARRLRIFVHKRQRILKYLMRKEPRKYAECLRDLGLDHRSVISEIAM